MRNAKAEKDAASVTDPFQAENRCYYKHTHISRFALEVIEKNYRKMREIMKTATAADDAPHFLTFRRFSYENRSSSEMEW